MISVIVWVVLAVAIAWFADSYGRNPALWGVASLFVSPLLCFIVLMVIGRKK